MIDTVFAGAWSANDDSGDIAVGPDGSLYVTADRSVRRIFPTGEERVFAGTGATGFTGDGGPATSATFGSGGPFGVLALSDGRVLVADNGNLVMRLVDQKGTITRIAGAGNSVNGVAGDGGAPLPAGLGSGNLRASVAPDGTLYFVSRNNQTIRRIRPTQGGNFSGEQLVVSEDGREVYRFDANGRHLQTLHALTHGVLYSFGYDAEGRLQQISDGDGNLTTIDHGPDGAPQRIVAPFGQETSLETDANGYLSSVTDPTGAETSFTSDALGRVVGKVDARGGQHAYQYDAAGHLVASADAGASLQLTRTGKAPLVTVTRLTAEGLQASYTTELLAIDVERRTKLREDGRTERLDTRRDQLQTLTQFDGTLLTSTPGPDPVWGMAQPLLAAFTERLPSGSTRAASETRTAVLNTPAQPLTLRSLVQSFTQNGRTSSLSYDDPTHSLTARSPRNRQRVALLDARGRITQLSSPGLLPAEYVYDAGGRLDSFTQGARSFSYSYDSDGYLAAIENGLGQVEAFSRDANGRVVARERADGSVLGLGYDAAGNLISLTPPGSSTARELTYTARDLLESYAAPAAGGSELTSYVYDDDDRLTQIFRPDGSSVLAGYDAAGRLGSVTLPAGGITLGYFASTGHLQTLNGPAGVNLTFQRDGELLTSTQWSGAVTGSVSHGYDTSRRLTSESINGANSISFGYDEDGLITSAGALVLSYDVNLPLLNTTTLGQVNDTRGYDTFGELASYSAHFGTTEMFAQSLVRDALGRVQQLTETVSGVTTSYEYGYDALGRLLNVAVDGVVAREYGYDTNGNRTSLGSGSTLLSASYDAQDRLLSQGDVEYAYAADGTLEAQTNLVTGDVTSYGYDALGNLRSVELPDGRLIEYVVDAMGRRVGKRIDGVLLQQWLYRSGPNPVAELNGAGALVKRYVYASRTDVPDYVVQGGATYRVLVDHLGSVRRVVNIANASDVLVNATYDEFGNASGTGLSSCPFGFAGGMFDADTQLLHAHGRDYSAAAGRWLSTDPLRAQTAEANAYAYLGNAPLSQLERTLAPAAPSEAQLVPAVFEETRSLARSLAATGRAQRTRLLPGLPLAR
jgi:RHS repeat-associated protein